MRVCGKNNNEMQFPPLKQSMYPGCSVMFALESGKESEFLNSAYRQLVCLY